MRTRTIPTIWVVGVLFAGTQVLGTKFISIGSDDWGRWTNHGPIWPNEATRQAFLEQGLWLSGGDPPRITSESEVDIEELLDFIESLNVGESPTQQVVLTPFWVVAGPDFEAMRDSGCPGQGCTYSELWWHNSSGGLAREPHERGDLRSSYRDGLHRGLWRPQYHGRSHFDVEAWTAYLRQEEAVTSVYFGHGLTYYHYGKRDEQDGMFHSTHSEYKSDHRSYQRGVLGKAIGIRGYGAIHARLLWFANTDRRRQAVGCRPEEMARWVEGGLASFKAFWGYAASVTAMPCHYGEDFVGGIFKALGIAMVEGEEGGRGLLPEVRGMGRVMFDPAFEREERWEGVLQAALDSVRQRLRSEGMVAVQWHAQNSLGGGAGGVLSERERGRLRGLFRRLVRELRAEEEPAVWVTASEMAQLAEQQWSLEGWPGWVRLRNYKQRDPVTLDLTLALAHLLPPPPAGVQSQRSEPHAPPRLWQIVGAGSSAEGAAVPGREVRLEAGCEYVLARAESRAHLPPAAQRLLPSPPQPRGVGEWLAAEGLELEALRAVEGGRRQEAVEGEAEWAPVGVGGRVGVAWEVRAAAEGAGVEVSVRVDGFEFLSAESGVRAAIGYAGLLLGHVRVATLFQPTRTIQVGPQTGLRHDERRGMRQGGGLAEVLGRAGEAMVSLALYHGDGTPMGVVSSIRVDLEPRSASPQPERAAAVQLHTRRAARQSAAAQPAATAAELRCLEQGAHCSSLCGWEGVVPVACPARARLPPPAQSSAPDATSWDSDALAVSVVVLAESERGGGSRLRQTLQGLRAASAYPLQRVVVVDRSPSPASAQQVLEDFAGWSEQLEVVTCPPGSTDVFALALAYARVETPWVLVSTDRHEFTGSGPWLAEAIAVLRGNPKAASVALLQAADRPHCPLLRAGKTPSNHSFLPFASSWESAWAGLTLLPALHRREAFALAHPIAAFPALADLEAFLRLLGYSALSLVAEYARVRPA